MSAQRAAASLFAALVVATFGAFFVAQRLKHGPTTIQGFQRYPVFSPNKDGRLDRARINFRLGKADRVTVDVVNAEGDPVKRLVDDRSLPGYKQIYLKWDGRGDNGREVPDGRYRVRITLREQGQRITFPAGFTKDTVPPVVKVISIGPEKGPGPELLPGKGPITVRFRAPDRRKRISIWRTYPGPVERKVGPIALPNDATSWQWDGTVDGRRVRPGSYVAVVEAQDTAQNIGSSVPLAGADRHPVQAYGRRAPSRGGITVRDLGVESPPAPLPAGRSAKVQFDARGEAVRWSLRRAGGGGRPIRRSGGTVTASPLSVPIPRGESGLLLLTVRAGSRAQTVPLLARTTEKRRVLVVLPAYTWQGRNPVDDDGDGFVNVLARGVPTLVGLGAQQRLMVGDGTGLPVGVRDHEAPVLGFLDRNRHRYDLTTDAALDAGIGPTDLKAYDGVLIPGDMRWLTSKLGSRLRAYVRGGGRVVSLGTQSLRAYVELSKGNRMLRPTALDDTDLFGQELAPLERQDLTIVADTLDRAKLFVGGDGRFAGYRTFEATRALGPGQSYLSRAITDSVKPEPVIVATRVGRGIVVRTGLPDLPRRVSSDPTTAQLMESLWTLLSR